MVVGVPKGPFIVTQLNSTQLNSTQVLRPDDATQLNWTQLDVELSWVELRRYKRALSKSKNLSCRREAARSFMSLCS